MKTSILTGITLTLIAGMLTAQVNRNGTVQGTILRAGSLDPIPNVTVTISPAQTMAAFDALSKAGEGVVMPGLQRALPELLTMSPGDLKDAMNQASSMSLPPAFAAALKELQATRENTAGFPKTVISDNVGHFTIPDVPAGRYTVTAQREGFFASPVIGSDDLRIYEYAPATVNPQQTSDISITLVAGAVMSGHVVDDDGQPLVRVNVQALSVTYQNGLPVLQTVESNETDDRGAYRIFYLAPGEYIVGAEPSRATIVAGPEVAVKTFFPNIVTPGMATPVAARLGDETAGIDIHMRKLRTAKISGTVVNQLGLPEPNPDGTPGIFPNAQLQMLQRDNSVPDDTGARIVGSVSMSNDSGTFTINGILPGIYDLYGRIADARGSQGQGGQSAAWGRAIVEVRDRDVEGVTLTVHPSVMVPGKLKVNGRLPGGSPNSIRVGLQPDGSSAKIPNYQGVQGRAQVPGPDGTFSIPGVAEGAYRVQVLGLPPDAYIEDIQRSGQPVFDTGIIVGDKKPGEIEVVVNTNGGTVAGSVVTLDRKPSVSSTVVLIPDAPHRANSALYKTATTDFEGHFSIRGIRPGGYKILAWETVPSGAYLNAVFLSKYEARAGSVNVGQQSASTAELTVIPKNN